MYGCKNEVEVWVESGYHGKLVTYKCGRTGIDGYPVNCPKCEKRFDRQQYRQDVADSGERIEEDY